VLQPDWQAALGDFDHKLIADVALSRQPGTLIAINARPPQLCIGFRFVFRAWF
jgi:hypothetical protein